MATRDTRKPIDRLTQADLRTFPVWEFVDDEEPVEGRDETWVRPVPGNLVPSGLYGLNVAARLSTRSGRQFAGLASVDTSGPSPQIVGAVLMFQRKYVPLPQPGALFNERATREVCAATGLPKRQLFPITVELLVPIQGHRGTVSRELDAAA